MNPMIFVKIALTGATPLAIASLGSVLAVLFAVPSAFAAREEGGFLNLRASRVFLSEDLPPAESRPFLGRAELVQNWNDWVFEISGESRESDRHVLRREDTRLIHHMNEKPWRWIAGDLNVVRRGFQISPRLGGLSLRKGQPAQPERTALRIGERRLLLRHTSFVEIFFDGLLFSQRVLPPGELDFESDPLYRNPGKLSVRVRDEFGQEETFRFDAAADMATLPEGESDFSYNVGLPWREAGGDRAYDTNGALTSLWHRYGWSERWTVGVNYQNWFYRHLAGLEVSVTTSAGLFAFEAAGSAILGVQGAAGRLRWLSGEDLFGIAGLRAELGHERRAETFFPVTVGTLVPDSWSGRSDLMVSKRFGVVAAGVGGVFEEPFHGGDKRVVPQGMLDVFLGANARLQANYQQVQDPGVREERALISLQWTEVLPRVSVSSFYDDRDRARVLRLRRENENETADVRAQVSLGRRGQGDASSAQIDGFTGPAVVRADAFDEVRNGARVRRTVVGVDTGLRWGDGGWRIGAPSKDAFQGE